MKVEILSISSRGDHQQEYVTLKVLEDCDIGTHVLSDTTYTSNHEVSSKLRHIFWIPDKRVKAGDFVQIHTRPGVTTEFSNKAGTTTHVFFWGLKSAVWNDDGDCAVLMEISRWAHKATN